MAKDLFFIPLGGSGGGGGDLTNYYTKAEVNALIADFVTASTNSLINYYLKSETYTQAEVNSLISAIETTHFEVYASLSDITNPQSNVLYLVGPIGNGSDKYEIYIYSNNQFVKIDDTSIDLSGYATTTDLQNAINTAMATLMQYAVDNFYQKSEVDALIAQVQTLQGIQGIKGSDGINGAQGIQGIKGADGTNGVDGQQGIQGIAGQNGTNGADGLQGIQGTMGIQGPAGGGGGATRYDISTKSQAELAEFYQNWQTVMASNDVYVGIYPVTSVIPEYTVQGYTALLLEYNTSFGLEDDETTQTILVNGVVGAYYILPNGMGGTYGTDVTLPSKDYVDAVANTKQDTLTAGEGISIQGTTISATGGGGGGNAWYGTQAEFDALQSVDTNTDYFISDPITWAEIADKPIVPTKISELPNDEGYVTDKEMKNYINERKIMHIVNSHNWYGTQAEYEALQTLNPDTNYHIEGDEVSLQMTFTFTDSTQAVYDVFVRPTV
jgi:hypothetical protein